MWAREGRAPCSSTNQARSSLPPSTNINPLLLRAAAGRSRIRRTGGRPARAPSANCCGESAVPASEIACIGLSGQMHGAVLLDRNDEVLRPALIWCDQRTAAECRYLNETIGPRRLVELDLQSRAHQLHPHQAAVGAHQRTQHLAQISELSAAQGLRPPLSHRGARHRRGRRLGHAAARRGAPPLVRRHAGCGRSQPGLPACSL